MSTVYKKGDYSPYIAKIQRALNETLKINLKPDGDFGAKSEKALKDWQLANNFPVTGIYHDATATILDAYIARRFLKEQDFVDASNKLKVEIATVKAVEEVESGSTGYMDDGRLDILFERHIFKRELDKLMTNAEFAKQLAVRAGLKLLPGQALVPTLQAHLLKTQPDIYNSDTGGYKGGGGEYDRLAKASILDSGAAQRSASWGLFQIMGFHYAKLGFKTVDDMVKSYNESERNQLLSFCDFVLNDAKLHDAMQDRNWLQFALTYNGPKQKGYDKKMAAAYGKFKAA